jgi:hypothetical protein
LISSADIYAIYGSTVMVEPFWDFLSWILSANCPAIGFVSTLATLLRSSGANSPRQSHLSDNSMVLMYMVLQVILVSAVLEVLVCQ